MACLRLICALVLCAASAAAQDLWDDTLLRTFRLTFDQPDWWQQLHKNKKAEVYIPADLEVDGIAYADVGVRFRGAYSFAAPNKKKPFKIKLDEFVADQELYGFDSLRLHNGFGDPSWVREVLMSRLCRDYMPMPKMVFIVLEINGEAWGPYVLVQQKDRAWMEQYFEEDGGNRYRAHYQTGFTWKGDIPDYSRWYDLMNEPVAEPWEDLIDLCDVVNNFEPEGPDLTRAVLPQLDLDGLLWFLAGDNAFGNGDSYAGNANNWYMVHDEHHDRMAVVNHDMGLSFGTLYASATMSPVASFGNAGHPLTSRIVMGDPDVRREYFAHLRTLNEEVLHWDVVGSLAHAYHALIDEAVRNDPKAVYSYQEFRDNLTQDVAIENGNVAPGVRPFVETRHEFLAHLPKLSAPQVAFSLLRNVPANPEPTEAVSIQAFVTGPASPESLELRWRVTGHFRRARMHDDGEHGDLAAGDGVFGASIPPQAPGARVEYFVVGTESTKGARSFEPTKAGFAPRAYTVRFGSAGLRITEYMYSGNGPEFVELTNTGAAPLDLSGWSLDDSSANPGTFDLSSAGVVAPGQSIVVTEGDAALFAADWGFPGSVVVLGGNDVANLGRNDAVHVFDAARVVQDRLGYGDEDFRGSVRAKGVSAWICSGGLGADDPYRWVLSVVGDEQTSWTSAQGDSGSPSRFLAAPCPSPGATFCNSTPNSTGRAAELVAHGSAGVEDNDLGVVAGPVPSGELGTLLMSDRTGHVSSFGGGRGVLCLGRSVARLPTLVRTSGRGHELRFPLDLDLLPASVKIAPGSTWYVQAWFRDGGTSNTSQGIEIAFY